MTNCMFIDEQHSHIELRETFVDAEHAVWSPVSNRHCCWTFKANPYGRLLWGAGFISAPQDPTRWNRNRRAKS